MTAPAHSVCNSFIDECRFTPGACALSWSGIAIVLCLIVGPWTWRRVYENVAETVDPEVPATPLSRR